MQIMFRSGSLLRRKNLKKSADEPFEKNSPRAQFREKQYETTSVVCKLSVSKAPNLASYN